MMTSEEYLRRCLNAFLDSNEWLKYTSSCHSYTYSWIVFNIAAYEECCQFIEGDPKEDGESQRSNTDMAYGMACFHF